MIPARLIVLAVLVITPWWFGAVHESTQVYVFAAIACACLCWLITRDGAEGNRPLVLVPLLVGVGLGLFQLWALPKPIASLVSPQTVELRDELLVDQEPRGSGSTTEQSIRYTVSLRPAATRYDLALLVLAVAGFVMGTLLFCSPQSRILLCWTVAINGALLAFFGLLQMLTWNGRFYWIGPAPSNDNSFSTFVNRNNAGGYLNLCLAAAIVLMLWAANRDRSHGHPTRKSHGHEPGSWPEHGHLSDRLANVDALKIGTAALAAIIVGAILSTLSRGAGIALLGATIVTALAVVLTGKKRLRTGGGLIVLVAGVGLVGWVGMRDAMVARFGTLAEQERLVSTGRVPNWTDALRSVADFWPAGSGLGTYRDIYPIYQERLDSAWYYYAENQYVQAVVEAGIPGLALLLLAIAVVLAAIWSLLKSATEPLDYAFAVGGLFAVLSQTIHSCFDFGLYLPANLLLMAVFCGAVTQRAASIGRSTAAQEKSSNTRASGRSSTAVSLKLAGRRRDASTKADDRNSDASAEASVGHPDASIKTDVGHPDAAKKADNCHPEGATATEGSPSEVVEHAAVESGHSRSAQRSGKVSRSRASTTRSGRSSNRRRSQSSALTKLASGFPTGGKWYTVLVGSLLIGVALGTWQVRTIAARNRALTEADFSSVPAAATAAEVQAAIKTLQARLPASSDDAELHYQLARAWSYLHRIQVFTELRRTSPPTLSLAELWDQASSTAFHRRAYELLRSGQTRELEALRNEPRVSEHLLPALQHMRLARQSCPILAKIHLRLARLCFLQAPPTSDAKHVRRARRLAAASPYTFVECGRLDMQAGRFDDACQSWQHALTLAPGDLEDVLAYAVPAMDLEKIIEHVLPPSPTVLLRLANEELPGVPASESRPLLLRRLERLAHEQDVPEDQRHHLLASVYEARGDYPAALAAYEKAVQMRPFEVAWRHKYGKLLLQEGHLDEAHEHIRWCARRDPESTEFRGLLEAIHKSRLSR